MDDEVVVDTEWGDLGSEDALIGTHSSMPGPFLFHARERAAVRPEEEGHTTGTSLGPLGAGGSVATPEVPAGGERPYCCASRISVDGRICHRSRGASGSGQTHRCAPRASKGGRIRHHA